ncbi:MAG: 30S ribosomal protein S5, partial [bacterium]
LEMAGVKNVLAKSLGRTNTKINVARATFEALKDLRYLRDVEAIRRSTGEG